jgi:hypothetical protein
VQIKSGGTPTAPVPDIQAKPSWKPRETDQDSARTKRWRIFITSIVVEAEAEAEVFINRVANRDEAHPEVLLYGLSLINTCLCEAHPIGPLIPDAHVMFS